MVGKGEDYAFSKEPDLTEMEWLILGGKSGVRIEIPVAGKYALRQIMGMVNRFATHMDFWTRQ
jgi:hypothetical protein